jgi:hypothetical protein
MLNKEINPASVANVLSALEDVGFTIDTQNNKAYWGNDTNEKMYFSVATSGSNTQVMLKTSNGTTMGTVMNMTSANIYKMTYEIIGDSIVFGFAQNTATYNKLMWAIVAPSSEDDEWLYCPYINGGYVINGKTEANITYNTTSIYAGNPLGVQIVKYYDGSRFVDNLYITTVAQNAGDTPTGSSGVNFYEITIGQDDYLVILLTTQGVGYNKIAIKKVA